MNLFKTLNGEVFALDRLTSERKRIYREVKSFYDTNPEWTEFSNFWVAKIKKTFSDKEPSLVVEEPIYKICQDLESRLGIRQGYTREPDYRDLLADIISLRFKSRYQFCKDMGIDEGYLSNVLNKKKHLSIERLQEILEKTNYRIAFMEKMEEKVR
jgi:transcriptional regulator with XRE-family HTH domain